MRVAQPIGARGSLKWLQRAVNSNPACLEHADIGAVRWLSPRRDDDFAEYRDAAFLKLLGLSHLTNALREFWPQRGPQWDALGLAGDRIILVEAKAHIDEFLTPATAARGAARAKIDAAFSATRKALNASGGADWCDHFYQYTNRLAHLHFLRANKVDARLLFVSFIGDEEMNGPHTESEWFSVFRAADYALGLPKRHALTRFVAHVYPDVRVLEHCRIV